MHIALEEYNNPGKALKDFPDAWSCYIHMHSATTFPSRSVAVVVFIFL